MLYNLYLIVAVGVRLMGLVTAIVGLASALLMLPLAAGGNVFIAPMIALFPSLLGATLWFLAKPVARAVTAQL